MRIISLGSSSSSGNSTYVEINNIKFLIDVGFSAKYMTEELSNRNIDIKTLDFVIITHAHSDHICSLYYFYRLGVPIYIGKDTFNQIKYKDKLKNINFVDKIDYIKDIHISKIPISHDAVGYGYVFECNEDSLVYIADTGIIYSRYLDKLVNKKVYMMESNHDVYMEMNGSKDYRTKIRNIGDMGHLSNEDSAKYLNMLIGESTKLIILIHISENDNTYEKAYEVNRKAITKKVDIKIVHKYEKEINEDI